MLRLVYSLTNFLTYGFSRSNSCKKINVVFIWSFHSLYLYLEHLSISSSLQGPEKVMLYTYITYLIKNKRLPLEVQVMKL